MHEAAEASMVLSFFCSRNAKPNRASELERRWISRSAVVILCGSNEREASSCRQQAFLEDLLKGALQLCMGPDVEPR